MTTTRSESSHFHAVKFYKDAESLAAIVCAFLADGLQGGEPALLIAKLRNTSATFGRALQREESTSMRQSSARR
jgi:hypothetical protein